MGQLDFLLQIFERYGVELVGSVLLAITISLFYRRSTIKEGLLSLSCASAIGFKRTRLHLD